MMRVWLGVVVWLLAVPAWSQPGGASLSGVVVLRRERGAPVAGVEITAPGANVVTTGNDGRFALSFPAGRPGQEVTVRVNRPGWEVVNECW